MKTITIKKLMVPLDRWWAEQGITDSPAIGPDLNLFLHNRQTS